MRILSFAVIIISLFVITNQADAQQRRGRFFQKIKQELFPPKKSEEDAKSKKSADSREKQDQRKPTAQRSDSRDFQNRRVPTLANPNDRRQSPQTRDFAAPKTNRANSIFANKENFESRQPRAPKPKVVGASQGFGFSVRMNNNDQLVVSGVDRNGNAAEEGLRNGDMLLEIGGIEAASVEEFEEISKVMGEGDQMEFKIMRNGREQQVDILFGEMPETEDVDSGLNKASQHPDHQRRYDFAPPNGSPNSVLSSNARVRPPANPPRNNAFTPSANQQIQALNQTIQKQNQQIQLLQQQIMQLQRQRYRPR